MVVRHPRPSREVVRRPSAPSPICSRSRPPSHCDAAKERLRPTVVSDAPEPVRREHRVKPVFPIGIIFYLASVGMVAIATVGVLFGIGFSLLVHPADALGAGAAARSHGSGVRPLFYGLVPNFFGDTVAADTKVVTVPMKPELPGATAVAALQPPAHAPPAAGKGPAPLDDSAVPPAAGRRTPRGAGHYSPAAAAGTDAAARRA